MMNEFPKNKDKITFVIEESDITLSNFRGYIGVEKGEPSQVFADFDTLEDALNCARGAAGEGKIKIDVRPRYGTGEIKYSSYEVLAFRYDEDNQKAWVTYEGEKQEFCSDYDHFDALELHPEVLEAYKRATQSFVKYLDYEDNGEGCRLFSEFLEDELGEDWAELGFIETYRH